jgi:hypothetical protein
MNKKLILMLMATLVCVGCASLEQTAGKVLSSTAITVDATMQGWAQWVAAGQATPEQEGRVKAAYLQYQMSMQVASSSYQIMVTTNDKTQWEKARDALLANSQTLISLVNSFFPPITPDITT